MEIIEKFWEFICVKIGKRYIYYGVNIVLFGRLDVDDVIFIYRKFLVIESKC